MSTQRAFQDIAYGDSAAHRAAWTEVEKEWEKIGETKDTLPWAAVYLKFKLFQMFLKLEPLDTESES